MTNEISVPVSEPMPRPSARGNAFGVEASRHDSSYRQIVKSTTITGGSQFVCLIIGMIRNKIVAMLIGPGGIGEIAALMSAVDLVGKASGLGIGSSAVREIAAAHASNEAQRLSTAITVLRRLCWATGLLGCLTVVALAGPLSYWTFGHREYTTQIMILAMTVFFAQLTSGQAAIIRGTRRISDMARQSMLAAGISTIVSAAVYGIWGRSGIVAVIVIGSFVTLVLSTYFARRVKCTLFPQAISETIRESRRLIGLGIAFTISSLVTVGVAWTIQLLIARNLGTEANGIYAAAFSLSLQMATFILAAMGADFYPRLAASASDHGALNRLVNEQTEVGVLIAIPGLLAMMAAAPWLVQVFYSPKFYAAAELMPWLLIGMFGRIVSWPMGYMSVALGRGRTYLVTESTFNAIHLTLVFLMFMWQGVLGIAISFAIIYCVYALGMTIIGRALTGFRWTSTTFSLLLTCSSLICFCLLCDRLLPLPYSTAIVASCSTVSLILCLRNLSQKLGPEHRISRLARLIFINPPNLA